MQDWHKIDKTLWTFITFNEFELYIEITTLITFLITCYRQRLQIHNLVQHILSKHIKK
jgi:hypothetical protein